MAMEDEIAAITKTADFDQMAGALATFAKALWVYFKALQEAGFTKAQALDLVHQYQSTMLYSLMDQSKTGGQTK